MRPAFLLTNFEDARVGVDEEIAGLWVHQKALFLDSKRDLQVIVVHHRRHRSLPASMTGGTASTANTAPSALTTFTSVPFFNGAPVTFQ